MSCPIRLSAVKAVKMVSNHLPGSIKHCAWHVTCEPGKMVFSVVDFPFRSELGVLASDGERGHFQAFLSGRQQPTPQVAFEKAT